MITDIAYTKFYYGSTYENLQKRFWRHKHIYKDYLQGKNSYIHSICLLFDEFGVDNCKIELVELYPTTSKIELLQREGHYIKNNDCINKVVAGRTSAEYYQDNKEQCVKWNKDWHSKNREKANQRKRENYKKNIDTLTSTIHCDCGSQFQYQNKSHHYKTKKHQNYIKQTSKKIEEETPPASLEV